MNGASNSALLHEIHNMASTLHSMAGGNFEVFWNNRGWNIICTQGRAYLRHSQEGELQFESIDDVGQHQIAIGKMQKAIYIIQKLQAIYKEELKDITQGQYKQEYDKELQDLLDYANTPEDLQGISKYFEKRLDEARQKRDLRQELAKQINKKAIALFKANGSQEFNLKWGDGTQYVLKACKTGAYLHDKDGPIYSFPQSTVGTSIDSTLKGYEEVHEIIKDALNKKLDHIKSQRVFNALRDNVRGKYKLMQDNNSQISQEYSLHQIPSDIQSAIRIKKEDQPKKTWEHRDIINKMSGILAEAINKTQEATQNSDLLSKPHFIKLVINFAQANGGVGNVGADAWVEYLEHERFDKRLTGDFNIAKELSRQYQIVAERSGFLTGRIKHLKIPLVGQRLYRIPSGATEAIVNGAFALLTQTKQK